ncbi:OsmC family peroxiredoxin [Ornithobacterium rhinotracheale]|uniref:OsmC family protein n=2 Tax=Ornithobacterium rhinotracheale TaxID=28251 RepID=UPI00129C741B|nr:OsmC family protein [Ornithobacterium rhinotracheale]MRJ08591.1 OsmC family peroxiredoxin [Ornithobacterium rhinotracheale]UOH76963.1 OsmC family protein [Ornithobacterium rhinotracheale]
MATIKIKNLPEGYQSIITNGKHTVIGDEPVKSKGTDLGMAPTEFLLGGIAMCKVATVRYVARLKNWEIGDVTAELSQDVSKGENGLKTLVKVAIKIEGDITEEQRAELLKQADNCYVHRMIKGDFQIENATTLD